MFPVSGSSFGAFVFSPGLSKSDSLGQLSSGSTDGYSSRSRAETFSPSSDYQFGSTDNLSNMTSSDRMQSRKPNLPERITDLQRKVTRNETGLNKVKRDAAARCDGIAGDCARLEVSSGLTARALEEFKSQGESFMKRTDGKIANLEGDYTHLSCSLEVTDQRVKASEAQQVAFMKEASSKIEGLAQQVHELTGKNNLLRQEVDLLERQSRLGFTRAINEAEGRMFPSLHQSLQRPLQESLKGPLHESLEKSLYGSLITPLHQSLESKIDESVEGFCKGAFKGFSDKLSSFGRRLKTVEKREGEGIASSQAPVTNPMIMGVAEEK